MEPARYRRVRELFERVIDRSPEEREALLDGACGEDLALRAEVEALVRQDSASGALDTVTRGAGGVVRLLADAVVELPARLGHYRVVREIGRGGMGVVYEAEQELPRRRVALKTLPDWNRSTRATALFRQEIQALGRVLHPGVPQVYEVFEDHGVPVLAMELVEGRPLLEAVGPLDPSARVALLIRVADAVQHAHDRGVVHRDLKPANVLVTPGGQPKVLDFGIAALEGLDAQAAGTLPYAPPEQLETGESGVRTDVYGLGALAWHVLCGAPPVDVQGLDLREAVARKRAPLPRPGLPAPLGAVLCKALSGDPEDRYATVDELGADLQRTLDDRRVEALRGSPGAWWAAAVRRHRRTALAVFALGVGALALTAPLRSLGDALDLRRREAAVGEALVGLQATSARLGPDHPAVAEGFRALVDDPSAAGTEALARAYVWRASDADGEERLDLLASAWVSAPEGPVHAEVLLAFAAALAAQEHWASVQGLLPGLPPDALPEVRGGAALAHGDFAEAERLASPDLAPFVALLAHARPAPEPPIDPRKGRQHAVRYGDVDWRLDGPRVWRGEGGIERELERLPGSALAMAFADLDRDGISERYTLTAGQERLLRAEPPEAESAVVPQGTSPSALALKLAVLPGRALATGGPGWRNASLRVFRPVEDGLVLAGRIRGQVLSLDWLDDEDAPRIVALMRPAEAPALPRWSGDVLGSTLVVARWVGDALQIEAQHALPDGCESLEVHDPDRDGRQDVLVACAYGRPAGGVLFRQRPDGSLVGLRLWGREPLLERTQPDAPGFWLRDARGVWWVGDPADPVAPAPAPAGHAERPLPPGLPDGVELAWRRSERLATLGEEELAALRFIALGKRADHAGTLALSRALELLGEDPRALDVAHRLALQADPDAATRGRVEALLRAAHEAEGLLRLGARGGWVDALGRREVLHAEGAELHPAWEVPAPEGVRFDPLSGTLRLDLVTGRGPVLAMPLDWDGVGVRVDLVLEPEEFDWSAGLGLELAGDGASPSLTVVRGGGGAPENHALGIFCGPATTERPEPVRHAPMTAGALRLSLSWVRDAGVATGTLRCAVNDLSWSTDGVALPVGPLALVVRSAPPAQPAAFRLFGRVERLVVAGAAPRIPARSDTGRAFVLGLPDAAVALQSSDRAIDRVLAAGGPRAAGLDAALRRLSESDLRFLLRTAPRRWTPILRRALGPAALDRWLEAWEAVIHFREPAADAALLDPALAVLSLDRPADRAIALARAERLLAVLGSAPEAGRLLEGLVLQPEASDAWLLVAALRRARGDEDGARAAVQAAVAGAEDRLVALDRVQADPRLAPLLDPRIPVAPTLR